jgi:hypothetical protein
VDKVVALMNYIYFVWKRKGKNFFRRVSGSNKRKQNEEKQECKGKLPWELKECIALLAAREPKKHCHN